MIHSHPFKRTVGESWRLLNCFFSESDDDDNEDEKDDEDEDEDDDDG